MGVVPARQVRWTAFERLDEKQLASYHTEGIHSLHAQLLYNRGLRSSTEMKTFRDANLKELLDPFDLIDMQQAVTRIQHALDKSEHITVFGDFDADGVTSAALLTRALRHLGQPAEHLSVFLPSRLQGPRGLSREALDRLHARGTTLIVTGDCGTSDVAEVDYARTLGIDVIITDHHHPPAQLPQAVALINTWRPACTYPERYLCGVGTAFKLAQALYRVANREEDVWELLDLVAIGTVGDVVPLLGENHTLVRRGLEQLNQTRNPGLQALCQVARLQPGKIRERDISFVLAPRINAAGRMRDAELAFRLLTTDDKDEAGALAADLEALNASRQIQTEELMKLVRAEAQQQADKPVILVYGAQEHWPEGIIGLVAGKMAEETRRPVFVLSQGSEVSRGSARSQEHFNLIQALQAARPHLFERFGGHAQAAGFTIANEHIAELHEHLLNWHATTQQTQTTEAEAAAIPDPGEPNGADTISSPDPGELNGSGNENAADDAVAQVPHAHKVDLAITYPERVNFAMFKKINELAPFGAGNPEPVFQLNNVVVEKRWVSGSEGRHLRLRLRCQNQLFNSTLLRGGTLAETFKEGSRVQVIFVLEQTWNSPGSPAKQEIWLKILDILASSESPEKKQ